MYFGCKPKEIYSIKCHIGHSAYLKSAGGLVKDMSQKKTNIAQYRDDAAGSAGGNKEEIKHQASEGVTKAMDDINANTKVVPKNQQMAKISLDSNNKVKLVAAESVNPLTYEEIVGSSPRKSAQKDMFWARIADMAAGQKPLNTVRAKKPVSAPGSTKNKTAGSFTLVHDHTSGPEIKRGSFAGAKSNRHANSDGIRGVFGAQVDVNDDTKPMRSGKGTSSLGSSCKTFASSGVADVFAHN